MSDADPMGDDLGPRPADRGSTPEAESARAHAASGPAGRDAPTWSTWSIPPRPEVAAAGGRPPAEPAPEGPPGYQIEREIGRGGMGVVYLARQVQANRPVALKMVLAGRGGPEALLRFRLEGESLARLQHPNIVQVHEVGEADGRPFFSMEYVEGGTLAGSIAEAGRSPAEAAALVEILARAVHAAHQCGVIHRDLKPSNILLARPPRAGGRGAAAPGANPPAATPKVTDFGLAKQVGGRDDLTHVGQILGTPSYMAPEQATDGAGVGAPADIYALGAILYELLAGRPPFRGETPWATMMQAVHEPVTPPSRSRPETPPDLEAVCLRCLAKEPGARYPSADALAEDLRRFLAGEPILARPAGPARRARLWCRRNPLPAALAGSLLLSALAGSCAVAWSLGEASRERAEKAFYADYLTDRILAESSAEVNPRGDHFTVRELLDRVGSRVGGDLQGHPEIEAKIRETVGKAYLSLGAHADSEAHLRAAARLVDASRGPRDPAALRVANLLAVLLAQDGRVDEAEALLGRNLEACRRALDRSDPIALEASARLGALLRARGRPAEAEPLIRAALQGRRERLGPDHPDTLRSVHDLCLLEVDRRNLGNAAALAHEYERGIRCARGSTHPDYITALANQGLIRLLQERPGEAEGFYRRAAEASRRILGDDHPTTRDAVAEHARFLAGAVPARVAGLPPAPKPTLSAPPRR